LMFYTKQGARLKSGLRVNSLDVLEIEAAIVPNGELY